MRETKPKLAEPKLSHDVNAARDAKAEKKFPDGQGLTLVVTPAGKAKWVHRYSFRGRTPERWLGEYPKIGLADARAIRDDDRALIEKDIDPIAEARTNGGKPAHLQTFTEYAVANFRRLAPPSERNLPPEKSAWYRTVTKHVGALGNLKIDNVRVTDVEALVKPMWRGDVCPPKATKIIRCIARVLDHRVAMLNPNLDPREFGWKIAMMTRLKKRLGDGRHFQRHRPSMPYERAQSFWTALQDDSNMSARILEFTLLTGVRVQECCGVRWREIDWKRRMWIIPPHRRKTQKNKGSEGRPFIVPLSLGMVKCLRRAMLGRTDLGPNDLIFPSYGKGKRPSQKGAPRPYSSRGILDRARIYGGTAILLDGSEVPITTHGFRTTVVTWGVGMKHRAHPRFTLEVMDRVLSHAVGNDGKTSAALPAYLGLDDPFLGERKIVMREWSAYVRSRPVVKAKPQPIRPIKPHLQLVA
jgi:Arm DNA-binding domain/Phage integrase family